MLILSRYRDESILIGDDIEIVVTKVQGDKVHLGIKAPRSMPIHRKEIYEKIKQESPGVAMRLHEPRE